MKHVSGGRGGGDISGLLLFLTILHFIFVCFICYPQGSEELQKNGGFQGGCNAERTLTQW